MSIQTMAVIATVREVGRLPIETIQWMLETFYRLHLGVAEIVEMLHTVGEKAKGTVEDILRQLRASPVVHGDETTWREDGQNGYVCSFSTPQESYFEYRQSRSGQAVLDIVGEDFEGVLVSDFYGGYNRMLGIHQRCWAVCYALSTN